MPCWWGSPATPRSPVEAQVVGSPEGAWRGGSLLLCVLPLSRTHSKPGRGGDRWQSA